MKKYATNLQRVCYKDSLYSHRPKVRAKITTRSSVTMPRIWWKSPSMCLLEETRDFQAWHCVLVTPPFLTLILCLFHCGWDEDIWQARTHDNQVRLEFDHTTPRNHIVVYQNLLQSHAILKSIRGRFCWQWHISGEQLFATDQQAARPQRSCIRKDNHSCRVLRSQSKTNSKWSGQHALEQALKAKDTKNVTACHDHLSHKDLQLLQWTLCQSRSSNDAGIS